MVFSLTLFGSDKTNMVTFKNLIGLLVLIGISDGLQGKEEFCTSESVPNLTGRCVNSISKCNSRGGRHSGKCGLFDVCCIFEDKCDGSSNEHPAYFQNENYSQSDFTTGTCTYQYHYGSGVCYVELIYVDFKLDQYDAEVCIDDYFLILEGSTTPHPAMCGDKSGFTEIVPVIPGGGVLKAFVYRSSGLDTIWNIKFTPIACTPEAPGSPVKNLIDDAIIAALEDLRVGMINGYPDLGIPPLDPLVLNDIAINVNNNGTRLEGSMTNVTMKNLATFEIEKVSSNLIYLWAKLNLSIPVLDTRGMYDMHGTVADIFPIYGNGPFILDAKDIELYGNIDLGMTDGGFMGVTSIDLDLHAQETLINFENIEGGGDMSDFINGVLSSLGPDILQSLTDAALPLLEEALKNAINDVISGSNQANLVK